MKAMPREDTTAWMQEVEQSRKPEPRSPKRLCTWVVLYAAGAWMRKSSDLHGWSVMVEKMHPAFSISMLVISVTGINNRHFKPMLKEF